VAVLLFPYINWTFGSILSALIDIFILALVFYYVLLLIRGTRAVQLLRGIVFLLAFSALSNLLGLRAISWLFENFFAALFVAIAVIFQP
jgi:diadenylate cyclase